MNQQPPYRPSQPIEPSIIKTRKGCSPFFVLFLLFVSVIASFLAGAVYDEPLYNKFIRDGEAGDILVNDNEPEEETSEETEEEPEDTCTKSYENDKYPSMEFEYDSCEWGLEESIIDNSDAIKLTNSGLVLTLKLSAAADDFELTPSCYTGEFVKVNFKFSRVWDDTGLTISNYDYVPSVLERTTQDFKDIIGDLSAEDKTTVCSYPSSSFVSTNADGNTVLLTIDISGSNQSTLVKADNIIKTLKY